MRYAVGRKSDLATGERKLVEINGKEIGLFNIDGQIFAILNHCVHQSGPVCEGGLFGNFRARFGPGGRREYRIEDDGYILACPWHGWEYDIRSGKCLWNPNLHLRNYKVIEDSDGNLAIDM